MPHAYWAQIRPQNFIILFLYTEVFLWFKHQLKSNSKKAKPLVQDQVAYSVCLPLLWHLLWLMSNDFTVFPGGRLSSISRVSSWLESYMKMPKHTILLLLLVKFWVSDSMIFPLVENIEIKMMLYEGVIFS